MPFTSNQLNSTKISTGVILKIGSFVTLKAKNGLFYKVKRIMNDDNCVKIEGSKYVISDLLLDAFTKFGVKPLVNEIVKLGDVSPIKAGISEVKVVVVVNSLDLFSEKPEQSKNEYCLRFTSSKGELKELQRYLPQTPKLKEEKCDLKTSKYWTPRSCKKKLEYSEEKENISPPKQAKLKESRNWRETNMVQNYEPCKSDSEDSDSEDQSDEARPDVSSSSDEIVTQSTHLARVRQRKVLSKSRSRKTRIFAKKLNTKPTQAHLNLLSYRAPLSVELERICSLTCGFDRALAMLQVSSVPLELPCREVEFGNIFSFVHDHLRNGTSGCIYVSGTPGTGKTATVLEAVNYLSDLSKEKELPTFKYLEVNGMKLTAPQQVYSEIWHQLKCVYIGADAALASLEETFLREHSFNREPVVLLVDELDLLLTSKQDILYNLFEWPSSKAKSKLIVVCIANTMDLPERVMMKRVSSRLGMSRVVFQPYTHGQLKQIISSRVQSSGVFTESAIEFAARKMSALSGDARRSLDICRRATELAQSSNQKLVNINNITDAFNEMFSSKKLQALKKCNMHEKFLLKAIVSEFRKCGLEEAQMVNVYTQYRTVCNLEGQIPLEPTVLIRLAGKLNAMKLIVFSGSKYGLAQKVILGVSVDDVNFALAKE